MMNWKKSLFDTCSLVAVDRLLRGRHGLSRHLPKRIRSLDESLQPAQLSSETAERLRKRTDLLSAPSPQAFIRILRDAKFTAAASDYERQMFAAAVHHDLPVVTGERELSEELRNYGREAASFVGVLWTLASTGQITQPQCVSMTGCLLDCGVAPVGVEATWESIEEHSTGKKKSRRRKRA